MDKANKAIRRSGIRLCSVKSGHSSLKLIVSDWKESRNAYKWYISNQETAWSDMIKWASSEHNGALKEVLEHVMQLQTLWSDVQTQFLTALKKFQHQFETILESELQLDKSRTTLNSLEQKETKLNKDLRKASTKSSVDDLKLIEERLGEVKISIQNAQMEVASNTTENESIKMLLMKEGLINLSNQFIELGDKTSRIFKAQKTVVATLPDAHANVQDLKYNDSATCSTIVAQTKKDLRGFNDNLGQASVPSSLPPPYYSPTSSNNASPTYFDYPPRYYNLTPGIQSGSAHSPSSSSSSHDCENTFEYVTTRSRLT